MISKESVLKLFMAFVIAVLSILRSVIKVEILFLLMFLVAELGRLYRWLRSEWRLSVLIVLLPLVASLIGTVIAHIVSIWLNGSLNVSESVTLNLTNPPSLHVFMDATEPWFGWINVMGLYLLFLFLWGIYKASNTVIIQEFENYTEDQSDSVKGLSMLLYVELNRLCALYSDVNLVNEMRDIPTSMPQASETGHIASATITAGDSSKFHESMVSSGSSLDLWGVKIPIGSIMDLLGSIARGPRITGSLHDEGGVLILTAQRSGIAVPETWKVYDTKPIMGQATEGKRSLDDMVIELTYRMFTDICFKGSARWRSTKSFSEGLAEYRECLRTPRIRNAKLLEAEQKFIEALVDDEKLDLAYHNLGVVYTERGQLEFGSRKHDKYKDPNATPPNYEDAARSAFKRAVDEKPDRCESHFALVLSSFEREDWRDVINRCKHIIDLRPKDFNLAKAHDLLALAQKNENSYVFKWDKITGNDNERLIEFLTHEFGIDWVKTAKIEKCDSGKTIKAKTEDNSLLLKPNDKETEMILEITCDGTNKFTVKRENNELNIYENSDYTECLLKSIANSESAVYIQCNEIIKSALSSADREDKERYGCKFLSNLSFAYMTLGEALCKKDKRSIKRGLLFFAAERMAKKALSLSKSSQSMHAYSHQLLGRIYEDQEKFDPAVEQYRYATNINPLKYMYLLARACSNAYLKHKEKDENRAKYYRKEAQEACEKALESLPFEKGNISSVRTLLESSLDIISKEDRKILEKIGIIYSTIGYCCDMNLVFSRIRYLEELDKITEQAINAYRKNKTEQLNGCFSCLYNKASCLGDQITKVKSEEKNRTMTEIDEKKCDEQIWEYAETAYLFYILYIYICQNKSDSSEIQYHKSAEKLLNTAIKQLESDKHGIIRHLNLHAWLAYSLLNQGKLVEAYKYALKAHTENPLEFFGHFVLGKVYLKFNRIDKAEKEWDDARVWGLKTIDDPHILGHMGFYSLKSSRDYQKIDRRNELILSGIDYLKQALDRYNPLLPKGWCHYWLGRSFMCMGDYEKAAMDLKIAKEIFSCPRDQNIETTGWEDLIVTLDLAKAHQAMKNYIECENLFNTIIEEIKKKVEKTAEHSEWRCKSCRKRGWMKLWSKMESGNIGKYLDLRETFSIRDMLLSAQLGLANSYVERDADLKKARLLVQYAEYHIEMLDLMEWWKERETDLENQYKAECAFIKGRILQKQDKIGYSITCLESAAHKSVQAKYYFYLALAYERKLRECSDAAEKKRLIELAQACFDHAEELDKNKEYSKILEKARQHLKKEAR